MRRAVALLACLAASSASLAQEPPRSLGMAMAKLNGTCKQLLTPQGDRTDKCTSWILNIAYSTGRSQFMVMIGDKESISFGGKDSPAQGDSATLTLDYVLTGKGDLSRQTRHEARGDCSYTNPYAGPSKIDCIAKTNDGSYELHFVSDGKPPQVQQM
jgi:hypothetical protein